MAENGDGTGAAEASAKTEKKPGSGEDGNEVDGSEEANKDPRELEEEIEADPNNAAVVLKLNYYRDLARELQEKNQESERQLEELQAKLRLQKSDAADIIYSLNQDLDNKGDEVSALEDQLLEDAAERDAAEQAFHEQIKALNDQLQTQEFQYQEKLNGLEEKLAMLTEYGEKKEAIEKEVVHLKDSLNQERQATTEQVDLLELKHIRERDRLRQEVDRQISEAKQAIRDRSEEMLSKKTRKTIRANRMLKAELQTQSVEASKINEFNKSIYAKMQALRRELDLNQGVEKEMAQKLAYYQRLVKQLSALIQEQDKVISAGGPAAAISQAESQAAAAFGSLGNADATAIHQQQPQQQVGGILADADAAEDAMGHQQPGATGGGGGQFDPEDASVAASSITSMDISMRGGQGMGSMDASLGALPEGALSVGGGVHVPSSAQSAVSEPMMSREGHGHAAAGPDGDQYNNRESYRQPSDDRSLTLRTVGPGMVPAQPAGAQDTRANMAQQHGTETGAAAEAGTPQQPQVSPRQMDPTMYSNATYEALQRSRAETRQLRRDNAKLVLQMKGLRKATEDARLAYNTLVSQQDEFAALLLRWMQEARADALQEEDHQREQMKHLHTVQEEERARSARSRESASSPTVSVPSVSVDTDDEASLASMTGDGPIELSGAPGEPPPANETPAVTSEDIEADAGTPQPLAVTEDALAAHSQQLSASASHGTVPADTVLDRLSATQRQQILRLLFEKIYGLVAQRSRLWRQSLDEAVNVALEKGDDGGVSGSRAQHSLVGTWKEVASDPNHPSRHPRRKRGHSSGHRSRGTLPPLQSPAITGGVADGAAILAAAETHQAGFAPRSGFGANAPTGIAAWDSGRREAMQQQQQSMYNLPGTLSQQLQQPQGSQKRVPPNKPPRLLVESRIREKREAAQRPRGANQYATSPLKARLNSAERPLVSPIPPPAGGVIGSPSTSSFTTQETFGTAGGGGSRKATKTAKRGRSRRSAEAGARRGSSASADGDASTTSDPTIEDRIFAILHSSSTAPPSASPLKEKYSNLLDASGAAPEPQTTGSNLERALQQLPAADMHALAGQLDEYRPQNQQLQHPQWNPTLGDVYPMPSSFGADAGTTGTGAQGAAGREGGDGNAGSFYAFRNMVVVGDEGHRRPWNQPS